MATLVEWSIGAEITALTVQYLASVVFTICAVRWWIIPKRIGPVNLVYVASWLRAVTAVLVCSLVVFLGYRIVLLANPASSWRGYWWTLGIGVLTYPVWSIISCIVGFAIDGGRALVVLSNALRPDQPRWYVDMTKEKGKNAQIIPRGSIVAYQLLLFGALLIAGNTLNSLTFR